MLSGVVALTLLFIGYAVFARRLARSSITGPIIFTVAGVMASAEVFGSGRSLVSFDLLLESTTIQALLEMTLVIILFSDAVSIDIVSARREAFLPERLLGIGLPLTIVVGTALAMAVFPGLGFWPAAVLAVILAPTDAALGQAVVSNEDVPGMVRQGLGIESGLNDGIAVPVLAVAVAGAANEMQTIGEIVTVFGREIGFAVAVGVVVGLLGAAVVRYTSRREWAGSQGAQISVPVLAIFSYFVADAVHGSGFIAAFVAGLVFGSVMRAAHPNISEFAETTGHLLTMLAFFVFGSLILVPSLEFLTWRMVVYAVLSLTVIRMVPVAIALLGTNLRMPSQLFIAWFGPRGLASLVFLGTVVAGSEPGASGTVIAAGAVTVGLSVMLHGLTAWPFSVRYAAWCARLAESPDAASMPEFGAVSQMPPQRLAKPMPHRD